MIAKIIDTHTIEVYDTSQFNIEAIMHSGQVFRYTENADKSYSVVAGQHKATLFADGKKVVIKCDNADYFYNYFDLETDYNSIKDSLSEFDVIAKILASSDAGGIRILRGDFYEMVISFIISANNNIKRFTKTLNLLAQRYGIDNGFPTLESLNNITTAEYSELGCGYRSAYLVKAVQQLKSFELNNLDIPSVRKQLLNICGVGPKVADCVMLFSNLLTNEQRFQVCPVDTWISKALEQMGNEAAAAITAHEYAGIAQQYIFYYMQHLKKELL